MTVEIKVLETPELLTQTAALEISAEILRLLELKPRVRIVLTGGTLGVQILRDLSLLGIPVSKLDVFWADERFVALDDSERNEHQALGVWPELRLARLFRYPGLNASLDDSAKEFSGLIARELGDFSSQSSVFDILILGMGPDGHVASLFPGHHYPSGWIISESNSPKPPTKRLSFSFAALNKSEKVWFLVSGWAKIEAARSVLQDPDCAMPAAKILGITQTTWFLDQELSRGL